MNPNQAFGLPERTMRALFAAWPMALTTAVALMYGPDKVPTWMIAGFLGAPAIYAGSRRLDGTQAPQQPVDLNAIDLLEQARGIKP